jgi:hypothetical protein
LDSGKLHIGYTTEDHLMEWNDRIAKFLADHAGDVDEEKEIGSDE